MSARTRQQNHPLPTTLGYMVMITRSRQLSPPQNLLVPFILGKERWSKQIYISPVISTYYSSTSRGVQQSLHQSGYSIPRVVPRAICVPEMWLNQTLLSLSRSPTLSSHNINTHSCIVYQSAPSSSFISPVLGRSSHALTSSNNR